ncbi:MAG TPA: hypothetical protein VFR08_02780, partial [Candidatus Angelobacter sp.]|nr:hypothetical protein [Candidatus Angelobacter sp.]
ALEEMAMALKAKDGLERRVSELKDALPALAQLGRPTRQEQKLMDELMAAAEHGAINLTRAVRLELAMSDDALTTVQIRDLLRKRRFSFSGYSNPMAAIHSALNRMASAGEVLVHQGTGKRPAYAMARKRVQPARRMERPQAKKMGSM